MRRFDSYMGMYVQVSNCRSIEVSIYVVQVTEYLQFILELKYIGFKFKYLHLHNNFIT